jgi:tRNA-dihydrouridine synthase B
MSVAGRVGEGNQRDVMRRMFADGAVRMVQLAGRDPAQMAEAARFCEAEGAEIIDINLGCPAKKVTGGYAGSALMREPGLVAALVGAVARAVSVPVSAKMRLGWDDQHLNASDIAAICVGEGAKMITVHGRTRCQFYNGAANWAAVAAVRERVPVPLVVNGDIATAEDAAAALAQSGADAVMVGRATYGAPWRAGQIARAAGDMKAGLHIPQTHAELADYVIAHHAELAALYGNEQGIRHARKHLGWYLDVFAPQADATDRAGLLTSTDMEDVHRRIHGIIAGLEYGRMAA